MVESKSKRAIQAEFLREYGDGSYRSVSVKDFCTRAAVSRSEFFASYLSIEDVMEDTERGILTEMQEYIECRPQDGGACALHSINAQSRRHEECYDRTVEFVRKNRSLFYTFLIKNPSVTFVNQWKSLIKSQAESWYFEGSLVEEKDLIEEVMACAIIGAFDYYLSRCQRLDVDDRGAIDDEKECTLLKRTIQSVIRGIMINY